MYVTRVPNRSSPPAVLLRESFREGGKVKTRTLANLSDWPETKVEALRRVLRGETFLAPAADRGEIERSLPHGHVAAVLGLVRKVGLDRLLPRRPERLAKLALGLIVARVVEPAAKLATARQLSEATASHSLGAVLRLGEVDEDELYRALDVLGAAQPSIEKALARRHLQDGMLVLYDVTSSYLEGRCCELARFGYSRDGRRDRPQIVFGLLCAADGCPVAVEVFDGDTSDPKTLAAQISKLKKRFGLKRVVLVGDRGMITSARIEEELKPAGLDWITALRAPAIQALAADDGPLQLSLFDDRDMAEISSPDFPGERLVVCRNPALARAGAQARRPARSIREGSRQGPGGDDARPQPAARRGRDRAESGRRAGTAQGRQALPADHHRGNARLRPQRRGDRPRGDARRLLRPAHLGAGRGARCQRNGPRLQEPRPRRARLPLAQVDRPRHPPRPPSAGRPGAGACLSLHAGLLRRLAHAPDAGAAAVRGSRPAGGGCGTALAGRRRRSLACRPRQGAHPQDRRRRAGAQLPHAFGRPRHADPQHRALRRQPADHHAGAADPAAATRLQPPRRLTRAVGRDHALLDASSLSGNQYLASPKLRKFGLELSRSGQYRILQLREEDVLRR